MANAINGYSGSGATSLGTSRTTQQSARDPAAPTTAAAKSPAADGVRITEMASRLASLGQKLSGLPAIDGARVARINQSLAAGTYRISADQIAGGLLQSDRALAQIGI